MNCTHANNPADAKYCIDCGALIAYEGSTQRLYQRRYVPSDDIEADITHPSTWSIEDIGKPLYITRRQLYNLLADEHLFSTPYANYVEIGTFLSNECRRIIANKGIYYSYYGREIIVIDD